MESRNMQMTFETMYAARECKSILYVSTTYSSHFPPYNRIEIISLAFIFVTLPAACFNQRIFSLPFYAILLPDLCAGAWDYRVQDGRVKDGTVKYSYAVSLCVRSPREIAIFCSLLLQLIIQLLSFLLHTQQYSITRLIRMTLRFCLYN